MDEFFFELEPDDHRYLFNGSEVPATTRILELARNSLAGVPSKVIENARNRGNAIHKAVELHVKRELDRRQLQREIKLRFDRFLRFCDFYRVEFVELPVKPYLPSFFGGQLCEVPLVHPVFMFGVTPDLGIAVVEGALTTVEVKATSLHNDATALQTSSQQNTINHFFEKHGYKVERRCSVRLTSDDKPDVRFYKDTSDWATFLSFMNVYNWRKVHKIK